MSGGLVCWRASTEPGSLWRVDPFTQSRTARVYLLRATAGGTCGSIAWHTITHADRWALSGWRSRCMWTRGGRSAVPCFARLSPSLNNSRASVGVVVARVALSGLVRLHQFRGLEGIPYRLQLPPLIPSRPSRSRRQHLSSREIRGGVLPPVLCPTTPGGRLGGPRRVRELLRVVWKVLIAWGGRIDHRGDWNFSPSFGLRRARWVGCYVALITVRMPPSCLPSSLICVVSPDWSFMCEVTGLGVVAMAPSRLGRRHRAQPVGLGKMARGPLISTLTTKIRSIEKLALRPLDPG